MHGVERCWGTQTSLGEVRGSGKCTNPVGLRELGNHVTGWATVMQESGVNVHYRVPRGSDYQAARSRECSDIGAMNAQAFTGMVKRFGVCGSHDHPFLGL